MCYRDETTIIGIGVKTHVIDEDKIRPVRTYSSAPHNYEYCQVSLPNCYAGKKVRVVVVEDEDEC